MHMLSPLTLVIEDNKIQSIETVMQKKIAEVTATRNVCIELNSKFHLKNVNSAKY